MHRRRNGKFYPSRDIGNFGKKNRNIALFLKFFGLKENHRKLDKSHPNKGIVHRNSDRKIDCSELYESVENYRYYCRFDPNKEIVICHMGNRKNFLIFLCDSLMDNRKKSGKCRPNKDIHPRKRNYSRKIRKCSRFFLLKDSYKKLDKNHPNKGAHKVDKGSHRTFFLLQFLFWM